MENLGRNCFCRIMFFSIDLLAFQLGKLCPGVANFVSFSTRGPEFCTEKLSRRRGF